MEINLNDYPELADDLAWGAKLDDVFSDEALEELKNAMVKDISLTIYRKDLGLDMSRSYQLVEMVREAHVLRKVATEMLKSLGYFRHHYPSYLEIEGNISKEYGEFLDSIEDGKAKISLLGGNKYE